MKVIINLWWIIKPDTRKFMKKYYFFVESLRQLMESYGKLWKVIKKIVKFNDNFC